MTIRYKNLHFDEKGDSIDIIQFKTKVPLRIHITKELLKYLFYFVDKKEFYRIYYDEKPIQTNFGTSMSISGVENLFYTMTTLESCNDEENLWIKKELSKSYKSIYKRQIEYFKKERKSNPNNFILDFLDNDLFENVVFNEKRNLSKKQRSRLQSKQVPYNKNLKELDDILKSNINITSHISRHSYAHNCLMNDMDYLVIQELLGHKNISTTQNYLRGIDKKFLHKKVKENIEKNKHRIRDHNPNY